MVTATTFVSFDAQRARCAKAVSVFLLPLLWLRLWPLRCRFSYVCVCVRALTFHNRLEFRFASHTQHARAHRHTHTHQTSDGMEAVREPISRCTDNGKPHRNALRTAIARGQLARVRIQTSAATILGARGARRFSAHVDAE